MDFYNSLLERGRIEKKDRAPDITPFSWIIESYVELSSDVNANGRIPWTVIKEFARINMIEDFEVLLHCIRVLESVFKDKNDGKAEKEL